MLFRSCFGDADTVLVADVYAAGETPIEGVNRDMLVNLIQKEWPSKTLNGLINHTKGFSGKPAPDVADTVAQLATWHD